MKGRKLGGPGGTAASDREEGMTRLFRAGAAIGLLSALWVPAPAFAQALCPALQRIILASREAVPFASLRREAGSTEILVPGFQSHSCVVDPGVEVRCWTVLAPPELELAAMETNMRACLGVDPAESTTARRWGESNSVTFVAEGLRFRVGNACHFRCRAGLIASFAVSFSEPGS